MTPERQVYLLDPKHLSPETIAVTFAKTSRSPESFREIAAGLTDEKSAEFHEKWVVGYGHASVAEHAVLHIAVENLSRLAVETLESCRLASYTEKSTRYQKWTTEDFFLPAELAGHPLRQEYIDTVSLLFRSYQEALPAVRRVIEKAYPQKAEESSSAWERRIRSRYVDICRYYLPAASLANVGMTINARALEHSISKMLSHPLAEVRGLGAELKLVGQACVPTLIKYAERVPYLAQAREALQSLAVEQAALPIQDGEFCRLVSFDADIEERILAAAYYSQAAISYRQAWEEIRALGPSAREALAQALFTGLGKYDIPMRELEYGNFVFDVVLDQGGYFELKRHRMMTQTPQMLTTRLGYALPGGLVAAGLEEHFRAAMQTAANTYEHLAAWDPIVAAYVVPNAYNRRVLLQFNLRSADHLLSLRSAPNAHFALRRVVQCMGEQIRAVLPTLGAFIRTNPDETWQKIEQENFAQVK